VQIALARLYMQRGTLDKARKLLEEAAKDPLDYEGNALLGELLINAGVPLDIAMEPLKRAVSRNGSHAAARHLLTRAYVSQGKFDEAQKQVDAWTGDNPSLDLAWQDAAYVAFHTGRFQDAEKFVKKSVPNNATDLEALRLKAKVLFARADSRAAFAALERANKLDPKDPKTFCEIGFAFVRQSNTETAMKAFEAALREDPKSLCGQVGPYHAQPSTRNRATKTLQGLLDGTTDVEEKVLVLATLARVNAVARALKAAESNAEEATQLLPFSAVAWYARAEVADKKRDKSTAADAWSKASLYDASWASARLNYAEVLAKGGDEDSLKKAIAEFNAVAALSLNEKEVTLAKKQVTALKKQLP
jgi:tetratricopeptide (TPR) repeat protein